jgi:membrane-bound serine protease (ClpP class)
MSNVTELLSNPDVLLLLLVIGGLGLATELVHPNLITGILGALALILAVIGLAGLPVNWLGLVLLAFGFVLIVLETQVASYGLLALGGAVAIALGAAVLFNGPAVPGAEPVSVSPVVILAISGAAGLVALGLGFVASRTRRMRAPMGQLGTAVPAGTPGVVKAALDPLGTVQLAGETWSARTPDERPLARDTPVRLVGFDRLTAIVEPADPDQPAATAAPESTDPGASVPAAHRP